jgi:hypothetical protein
MTHTHEFSAISTRDLLGLLVIGAPTTYRGLSVFPLTAQKSIAAATYLVLDEALITGQFRITEVSEAGTVPRLLAINETDKPVFLLDGEELVGAKQNRVLNLSLMVAPKSRTEIPVSCVEAGRWHMIGRSFQTADRAQFALARAQKMQQVSHSLHLCKEPISDQHAVWDAIAAKSSRMGVVSSTSAMSEIFEGRREDIQDYVAAFRSVEGQIGAVYAIGRTVSGIEIFEASGAFEKLARKLVASYALDTMEFSGFAEAPPVNEVQSFIDWAKIAPCERFKAPGTGETVRFFGNGVIGAALEVENSCVHLAAFRRDDERSAGFNLSGARLQRSSLRGRH